MRLLLDTHIALWWITYDTRLDQANRRAIENNDNDVKISIVTIWEIAIKHALKRGQPGDMPLSGKEALAEFNRARIDLLPVTAAHAAAVDDLPRLHGDPFDRMLVAQAMIEGMRLLTRDTRLADYGALVMLV